MGSRGQQKRRTPHVGLLSLLICVLSVQAFWPQGRYANQWQTGQRRHCRGIMPAPLGGRKASLSPFRSSNNDDDREEEANQRGILPGRPPPRNPFRFLSSEVKEVVLRRFNRTVTALNEVDRCALYLRAMATRGDRRLELFPAAVYPEVGRAWMMDHVVDVMEADEFGDSRVLSDGCLAVPIRYRSKWIGVLVVSRNRTTGATGLYADTESWAKWTHEQKVQVTRIARNLGTVLMETKQMRRVLVGLPSISPDEQQQQRQQAATLVAAAGASSSARTLPLSPPSQSLVTTAQELGAPNSAARDVVSRQPLINATLALPSSSSIAAFSTKDDGTITIPSGALTTSSRKAAIPSVTTFLSSRNLTLNVELVEEFSHIFDTDLSADENNPNMLIIKVALPVVGAMALEPVMSLIDTYYVGRHLGAASLSAYGLSERVFVFAFYILNFLATSTTPIVANLRAQGEEEAAQELVGRLLFFGALFGFFLIPLLQVLCYPVLTLLGAQPENFQEAVEYYQVRSLGAPAAMFMAVANGALRGYLDTATPLLVAILAFIIDYSIDPEIIYPQDPNSLAAAGAATVVAEYSAAGFFLIKFLGMNPPVVPIIDFFPPWAEIAPVIKASGQIFIRTILLQALLATSCAAAARIGPLDIAAHQVALQLWLPPSFLVDAFSVAAQGLVADAVGRGDRRRARDLSIRLLKWGVALGGLLALIYAGLELWNDDVLVRLFTEDVTIAHKVTPIVWLIALMQPLAGFVNVGAGVLQGRQDFAYQAITMGISALFSGSLFVLLQEEGLEAIWETLLAFQVMRAVGFAFRFWEPFGPLSVPPDEATPRRKPQVLVGQAFDTSGTNNSNSSSK